MDRYSPNLLADSLASCALHNPSGDAIVYGERRVPWAELTPRVFRVANALIDLGVEPGDTVSFMFHNTPEFLEVNFGIQVAGAIPVPMNYRFTPREVAYQGNHCDARVFLYDSLWAEAVEGAASDLGNVKHFVRHGDGELAGALDYDGIVAAARDTDPQVRNAWEDVAVMIYTGGTTGFPKGVMLTWAAHREMFSVLFAALVMRVLTLDVPAAKYRRILGALPVPALQRLAPVLRTRPVRALLQRPGTERALRSQVRRLLSDPKAARRGYRRASRMACPSMPFFHDAAYANLMFGALSGSMVFVLPDSVRFDPAGVLRLIERERITEMANVPTGWKKLVSSPEANRYDVSSLRIATTGGGVCPAPLKRAILELFPNAMVLDAFGQTEMTPVTSFRIDAASDTIQDRSVGRSIVDLRVVDEQDRDVPRGQVGEILYRSETVMKGYYKDDERTREALQDGWFRSGDLGFLDEAGEIRVVDRKQECINTGGEKVYPLEVEEVIREHPRVEDACIIGVPDEVWGTAVRAVVRLREGERLGSEELLQFCRDRLAGYKVARSVVFVDDLPVSPVGKVLRQRVRDLYGET
jgi:acyl-CoA synthetase (AMP-forming)/AMP-acid ligase II